MAASALLAEALQPALAHECWQPDVDIADAVPKMVCAQLTDITGAVLDLRGELTSSFSAYSSLHASVQLIPS